MPKKKSPGLGEKVYDSAAAFGKFRALMGAIIGTLIGIVLIGVGIYYLTRKSKFTESAVATVDDPDVSTKCPENVSTGFYNCTNLNVDYSYNGTEYDNKKLTGSFPEPLFNGELINIWVDPNHPDAFSLTEDSNSTIGVFLLVFGILGLIAGWLTYIIVSKFKFAAAAEGVTAFLPRKDGIKFF